jgi:HEAT repeat protein
MTKKRLDKSARTTAAEVLAKLGIDPSAPRLTSRPELVHDVETRALLRALHNAGLEVESVSDLFNRRINYSSAIPILLDWLPRLSDPSAKEAVARALSVKWAQGVAVLPLLRELKHCAADSPLTWSLASALEVTTDENSPFHEIEALAQDERYGIARQMLTMALAKSRRPQTTEVLLRLLQDPTVAGHAIMALGRLAPQEARAAILPFVSNEKAWIRKQAKQAIARIDRARH